MLLPKLGEDNGRMKFLNANSVTGPSDHPIQGGCFAKDLELVGTK